MVVVEQVRKLMYYLWEGGKKGGREGEREGGREGGREEEREGGREGGRKRGREREREGGREGAWEGDGRKVQEMKRGRKKRKGNWRLREVERIIKIFCII